MAAQSGGAADREQRFHAVIAAYLQAVEAGRAPDRAALLRQHPEFAAELAAFLEDQERFARQCSDPASRSPALTHPAAA